MSARDRQRWDATYRQRYLDPMPDPDPLLFQYTPPVAPEQEARALDLASGLGQNGLWLATQGYIVDLMDISRVALTRSKAEAGQRGLRNLNFLQVDLETVELEPETYDLACGFRFLLHDLFPKLRASIRPGGRVIYATFNSKYEGMRPDINPAYLLQLGQLAGYFADWKILYNDETTHVSQVVAVKPKS